MFGKVDHPLCVVKISEEVYDVHFICRGIACELLPSESRSKVHAGAFLSSAVLVCHGVSALSERGGWINELALEGFFRRLDVEKVPPKLGLHG
jgi:hypothetical protein